MLSASRGDSTQCVSVNSSLLKWLLSADITTTEGVCDIFATFPHRYTRDKDSFQVAPKCVMKG